MSQNMASRASITIIRIYQRTLSFDTGVIRFVIPKRNPTCAFFPTCSEYAVLAIKKYGFFSGWGKAIKRISRCHPWQTPAIDQP